MALQNQTSDSTSPPIRSRGFFGPNLHFLLVEMVLLLGSVSLAWIAFQEISNSGLTTSGWTPAITSCVLALMAVLYALANPPSSSARLNKLFAANPGVVEVHPNGRVVVAGHRISLFAIMESLEELSESPQAVRQLCVRYPTIDPEQMAEVVNFLRLHEKPLRAYHANEKRIARKTARRLEKDTKGPTLEELRRRRAERLHSA